MSRLIDADVLTEEIKSLEVMMIGVRSGKSIFREFMNLYRDSVLRIIDEQATAYDADKVVDACAEVVSKIQGLCGKHCPVDCHYFTKQSCKESWKLYLEEHLKEGEKDAGNI